jgi:hypothetical protein
MILTFALKHLKIGSYLQSIYYIQGFFVKFPNTCTLVLGSILSELSRYIVAINMRLLNSYRKQFRLSALDILGSASETNCL